MNAAASAFVKNLRYYSVDKWYKYKLVHNFIITQIQFCKQKVDISFLIPPNF